MAKRNPTTTPADTLAVARTATEVLAALTVRIGGEKTEPPSPADLISWWRAAPEAAVSEAQKRLDTLTEGYRHHSCRNTL